MELLISYIIHCIMVLLNAVLNNLKIKDAFMAKLWYSIAKTVIIIFVY